MPKRLSFMTGLLIAILSTSCMALPDDKNQLAQLEADQVDFDTQTHQGNYQGHVKFSQGSSHLEADEAHTRFDDHNQIVYAKALSSPFSQTHFWTKMNPNDPDFHAYARQIEYFPDKRVIILTGSAKIKQGDNIMTAPVMAYHLDTHHLSTKLVGPSRTRLLIHPDKHHV